MWRFIANNRVWVVLAAVVLSLAAWFAGGPAKEKPAAPAAELVNEPGAVTADEIPVQKMYQEAVTYKKEGDLAKAKDVLKTIYAEHPDFENIEAVQKELEGVNMALLFSMNQTPNTVIHEVVSGDTLGKLAKKYNTTIELIKQSNKLKGDVIHVGQRLRIWTAAFDIFVDKSQNILMVKTGGEVLKTYRVSTGEGNSTPVGEFTIAEKLVDPVWFNKGAIVPPDSPANVLGTRWLGFNIPHYGIHGTVEPETIGQQVTAGCVRMRNEEVEELFNYIPRGTKVVIVD